VIYAYELVLRFDPQDYDSVQASLLELDVLTFQEGESAKDSDGNIVLINENSLIKIASEDRLDLEKVLAELTQNSPHIHASIEEITTDFNQAWKEFSNPILVSDNILIQPSWLEFQTRRKIEIVLDPGLAFGSGSHETTLLCMRKLEEMVANAKIESVLDVGCGSGILSILAAKLGVSSVMGIDNDDLAIVASNENTTRNGISNIHFSTMSLDNITHRFDLVVANIISSVLDTLMPDIKGKLKPNGILILSGLLKEEIPEFKNKHGLEDFEEVVIGDWGLIVSGEINRKERKGGTKKGGGWG